MAMLVQGSQGSKVIKVQQRLGIRADGDYGPQTKATVKAWQKANGLPPTGVVDSDTWNRMFDSVADVEVTPQAAPPTQPEAVPQTRTFDIIFKDHLPPSVIAELSTIVKLGGDTNLKMAHFLAQCAHESGDFKLVQENLKYSAARLQQIFPKYFPGDLEAEYAGKPEKIASRVYADRLGNGNEASGDGWKYRGRGYIQLTGKSNYQAFSAFIGEDCVANPDLVATKYPLASAGFFFQRNDLWDLCLDRSDATVEKITRKVNGGTHGLEDRIAKFRHFNSLL